MRRWGAAALAALAAIVAGALATFVTIDLGPLARARAERLASNYLHRPMHIGRLSAKLRAGAFELDDVVIEGLTPDATPFLRARRITIDVPWWTLLSRRPELIIDDVHMTGWEMTIETFPDGTHNVPKLTPDKKPGRKAPFTTTARGIYAEDGVFVYRDHGAPWSVVAPNLSVRVVRSRGEYRGTATFAGGTVRIQQFLPMRADMQTQFRLEGGLCVLEHINLVTDGAHSQVHGLVDFAHWPEQRYIVSSRVDFPRMRDIFFAGDRFALVGQGTFDGVFHLYKGGRELSGTFASDLTGIDTSFGDYRLTHLTGSLDWLPTKFEVRNAQSEFYGGHLRQHYLLAPLGSGHPATARWETSYDGVDLQTFGNALEWPVLRLDGIAHGENTLVWPNGTFHQRTGSGFIAAVPKHGEMLATRELPSRITAPAPERPFRPDAPPPPFPAGGEIHYRWEPDWLDVDDSWAATPHTFIALHGRTAYGSDSELPFHMTSTDWQESDRLLVAIKDAFNASSAAIDVGGYGTFDGVMTKRFTAPRIAGVFSGGGMRAWDVVWGAAKGELAIENDYVDIVNGVITGQDGARIMTDGRYSLGYPRADRGEELDARVSVAGWPAKDLRHAFKLDDWPVDASTTADLHLYGHYETPDGFGRLRLDRASAWGETFDFAEGGLRFEGPDVRIDNINGAKSTGHVTGAALVAWNGTYTFDADGDGIPVASLTRLTLPAAKLGGRLHFTASGNGAFASPTYEVHGDVTNLTAGDEAVGDVKASLWVKDQALTMDLAASSPRLNVTGAGTISLDAASDARLQFRFVDTSIDPYLRLMWPNARLSPLTRAQVSGSLAIDGPLADRSALHASARLEHADLQLYDYALTNAAPIALDLDGNTVTVGSLALVGESTKLNVSGHAALDTRQIDLTATGDVNLAVLQMFSSDLSTRGAVSVQARITGDLSAPVFSGQATVQNGRVRFFSLPTAVDDLHGVLSFDRNTIRLDELRGTIGRGDVQFGGRVGLRGYVPSDLNITLQGRDMVLRYPEGFQTTADADLALRGTLDAAVLSGTVTVDRALMTRPIELSAGLLGFINGLEAGGATAPAPAAPLVEAPAPGYALPLSYEVRVTAPPASIVVENHDARLTANADLTFRGTYAKPTLTGRVEIDRGDLVFLGNRYLVRQGSISFVNPNAIEPYFDIDAETRVRVPGIDTFVSGAKAPGQDYVVTVHVNGTTQRFTPTISSEPRLPMVDALQLLFGETPNTGNAEVTALQSPQEAQNTLLRTGVAQLVLSPLTEPVGRVSALLGIDTVQISPLITASLANPAARVTLGKRLSPNAFLTYSREVNGVQYEVLVLEYDQSDRLSWVVSRNEDQTYALDVRVRHIF